MNIKHLMKVINNLESKIVKTTKKEDGYNWFSIQNEKENNNNSIIIMKIKINNFCDFIMSRDIYEKPSNNEEKDKKSNSKLIIIIVIISIVFVAIFIILYCVIYKKYKKIKNGY